MNEKNLMLVDVCNVKIQGRIRGSLRNSLDFLAEKATSFSGFFKTELVVDSYQGRGACVEREVLNKERNIERIFVPGTADNYILDTVSNNKKSGEYREITIDTDDKGLRTKTLLLVGIHPVFNIEFLGVADFLNNHHSKSGLV